MQHFYRGSGCHFLANIRLYCICTMVTREQSIIIFIPFEPLRKYRLFGGSSIESPKNRLFSIGLDAKETSIHQNSLYRDCVFNTFILAAVSCVDC